MAENDTQTELKKRARRRLVGAVALVTVTAIVLPAVMDHEPRQPVQDVQIRIPSQENGNLPGRMLAGKAPAPAKPVAGAVEQEGALPPSEEPAAPEVPTLRPAPVANAAPVAGNAPITGLAPPPPPPGAARREVAAPLEERKPEPAPQPEARKDAKQASEKALDKAADKPHKAEKSEKSDKADKDKADKEKADKAEASKKADKSEKEKARAEALLNSSRAADSGKSSYVIQLGAYKDESNVKSLRAKLKAEGYNSYTEQIGDRTRVRAGPFSSKEAADKAAARIRSILGVSAMVAGK